MSIVNKYSAPAFTSSSPPVPTTIHPAILLEKPYMTTLIAPVIIEYILYQNIIVLPGFILTKTNK